MIKTILGLILILIPFLLINKFENKKKGFYIILFSILGFQFIIAFLFQLLGFFNYINVLILNILIDLIIIYKTNFKEIKKNIKNIKIDWYLVFLIIIVFICLYSVHHNYTGEITTINDNFKEIENFKYHYPYFSDEWAGISLIKYSIDSGKLPFVNPLWYNQKFVNLGFAIHTLSSEFILVLNLNPLTDYIWLSFFSGFLICLLVYFILRENKISKFSSLIASISVLYITRGANLPGVWTLIPLIGGIIFMLFVILFLSLKNEKFSLFSGIFSLIFYPPMIIFVFPIFLFYYLFNNGKKFQYFYYFIILLIFSGLLLSLISIFLGTNSFHSFLSSLSEKLFYEAFTTNAIPDFAIWKVVLLPVLILSIVGFIKLIFNKKKLWIVSPVFVGLVFWFVYSFNLLRLIIGYERLVFATSVLIVLLSGFGLDYSFNYIKKFKIYKYKSILKLVFLVLIFILSLSYTNLNNWSELKLYNLNGRVLSPAAPANQYLIEDDLRLFNFNEKRFITIPWKGLVIGVATDNYPLNSKAATLTNKKYDYYSFINSDCNKMKQIIKKYNIDYIYTNKDLNCEFEKIGESEEGLILYKTEI